MVVPILEKLGEQKNSWLPIHHIRKRDPKAENKTEPLVKADSVIHWLECASGHRSIINQTTNRWAIDNRELRNEDTLLLRVAAKGKAEGQPIIFTPQI